MCRGKLSKSHDFKNLGVNNSKDLGFNSKQIDSKNLNNLTSGLEYLIEGETNLGKIEKHFEDVKSRIGNIKGITKQNTSN